MASVNALKRVVTPLAGLMSARGVKVSFKGDSAFTRYNKVGKPIEIVLPLLQDSADSKTISAFHGYFDHEIAHVLFSDLQSEGVLPELKKSAMLGNIFNIVEDARIEREIVKKYRGCAYNLSNLHAYVFDDKYIKETERLPDDQKIINYLIFATRKMGESSYFSQFSINGVESLIDTLSSSLGANCINSLKSTADAVQLSKKIVKLLKLKEIEGDQSSGNGSEQSSSGDESGDSDGKSKGKGKGKGKGESKKDIEGDSASSSGSKQKSDKDENVGSILSRGFNGTKLKSKLKESVKRANADANYYIDTVEKDVIEIAPEEESNIKMETLHALDSRVGTLQKNLERAMSARSVIGWVCGQRKGKIQGSSLNRLLVKDDHVFKRRLAEQVSKDVAVSLVIDCSGSMIGHKSKLAAQTGYALSKVLTNLNIKHEVIGFTTKYGGYGGGTRCARYAPLYIPIFKTFDETLTARCQRRMAGIIDADYMCNNVDGESIQICADRLMLRPEKRKVMIVLSDGYPNADGDCNQLDGHLIRTVKSLEGKMSVVGIGINSTNVKRYYKKYCVINDINDLPSTVIHELRNFLLP